MCLDPQLNWCLLMVERLFLAVPRGCLQLVIVVFPDHTHSLFFHSLMEKGIHDFCGILVLLKGTDIFLLFLRG